jgi:hypothetical protein
MTQITLDPALRAKLNGLNEEIALCDEAGRTVGHFVPEEQYKKLLYAYAMSRCPYSKEELETFRQETGGKPLTEIWKDLGVQ